MESAKKGLYHTLLEKIRGKNIFSKKLKALRKKCQDKSGNNCCGRNILESREIFLMRDFLLSTLNRFQCSGVSIVDFEQVNVGWISFYFI